MGQFSILHWLIVLFVLLYWLVLYVGLPAAGIYFLFRMIKKATK